MSDDFNWHGNKDVVIKPVRAVALYWNPDGDLVIRQEKADYQDDDPFILIPPTELDGLISKLQHIRDELYQGEVEFDGSAAQH